MKIFNKEEAKKILEENTEFDYVSCDSFDYVYIHKAQPTRGFMDWSNFYSSKCLGLYKPTEDWKYALYTRTELFGK